MADRWDSALYDDRHSFVWKNGADLIDLLDPHPGERILDIGCGTGHLTAQIAARGAEVIGLDSSASMIALARQNFPNLKFRLADARDVRFDTPFDAAFSNAVLHWVPEADRVVRSIAEALKPRGRLVLEMGGKGNIARLTSGVEGVLRAAGYSARHKWYFPSVAEYAALLEQSGFEVQFAQMFPRWNKLEHPERGLREWLEMFGGDYLERVPADKRDALIGEIESSLRPTLWRDGAWYADYRRLRIVAEKWVLS
jgi:trans-aconitate methyltransferase